MRPLASNASNPDARDVEVCRKRTFRAPEDAHRMRKFIKRHGGDALKVYRCDVCGWWHLGHSFTIRARPSTKRTKVRIR